MRDQIFDHKTDLVDFVFDPQVAEVFDDMVGRSVPGYRTMIEMVGLIAAVYGRENSRAYDLGASTGAVALALGLHRKYAKMRVVAVDNSAAMVRKCEKNLAKKIDNYEVICGNIEDICCENASIIILHLSLQFIVLKNRARLLKKIYRGLNPGGVVVIFDKIHFADKNEQRTVENLHADFKRKNGYSALAIAQKRKALERVLKTETAAAHLGRLRDVGFGSPRLFFQCLNFAAFFAQKSSENMDKKTQNEIFGN